jgi:hypothetical protein
LFFLFVVAQVNVGNRAHGFEVRLGKFVQVFVSTGALVVLEIGWVSILERGESL